jgi:hypothetical protein
MHLELDCVALQIDRMCGSKHSMKSDSCACPITLTHECSLHVCVQPALTTACKHWAPAGHPHHNIFNMTASQRAGTCVRCSSCQRMLCAPAPLLTQTGCPDLAAHTHIGHFGKMRLEANNWFHRNMFAHDGIACTLLRVLLASPGASWHQHGHRTITV